MRWRVARFAIVVTLEFNRGGETRSPGTDPVVEPSRKTPNAWKGRRRARRCSRMLVKITGHCYRPDNDRLDLSVDFLIYRQPRGLTRGGRSKDTAFGHLDISIRFLHTLKTINYNADYYIHLYVRKTRLFNRSVKRTKIVAFSRAQTSVPRTSFFN